MIFELLQEGLIAFLGAIISFFLKGADKSLYEVSLNKEKNTLITHYSIMILFSLGLLAVLFTLFLYIIKSI